MLFKRKVSTLLTPTKHSVGTGCYNHRRGLSDKHKYMYLCLYIVTVFYTMIAYSTYYSVSYFYEYTINPINLKYRDQ